MVRFEDIDAWLMQRQLVDLLNMARQNIMQHTMVIYGSGELGRSRTVKKYLTVQTEGTSDARNAKIFNIFSLVKIGERSGMGLSQLYGNWEEAGYARPQLSESFSPERTKVEIEVEVTENRGEVAEKRDEVTGKRGEVTEKDTEKQSEVTEIPNETDERIIALILSNPHITQRMLSEAIGLTRPYIGRKLLGLQARKIIRRVGPDRGGYWEVIKGSGR